MGNIVTVDFHGDQLLGSEDGRGVFAALKPIVEGMGIDWSSQHKRLQRDPVLATGLSLKSLPTAGGMQTVACLRADLLPAWLTSAHVTRMNLGARPAAGPACRRAVAAEIAQADRMEG